MFNLLVVSIIVGMCGGLHHSHDRNEMVLNAPVTIQKCNVSIFPKKRNILCQRVLPERERVFIQSLFETAHKERSAFVCCEFFLQAEDGRNIGILMDDDQGLAEGFDLGIKMNAKETRTKRFHNMRIIRNHADQKRLYSLVHELFPSSPKETRKGLTPMAE